MPGTRPVMTKLWADPVEPIEPLRGAEEQIVFLVRARTLRQNLAGVPEHRIAIRALVDGEIALEHAARRAEGRDTGFDIGPPRIGERLRGRRIGELFEAEAANAHPEPAELHVDIRPLRQRLNGCLPAGEHVLVLV